MDNKSKKLIVFDVDGVLLNNERGAAKEILILLDKEKKVKEIDEEYQRRKHLGPWGLEELMSLYQGYSSERLEKITSNFCQKRLMPGAKEVMQSLKDQEFIIGAISSNSQLVLNFLKELLGLNFAYGLELEFKVNIATGRIKRKVDRYIKAEILRKEMEKRGFSKEDVTVIGDSITDLPMAKEAGKFIAFNAKKEKVKKQADVVIEKKDLREILKYVG